ncbi:MAG: glutamate-5-semialdehyde dehydrogenase [Thermoplasmata archaeon]|jgi:glutamate-5-semialdehyde dehydrogenase|nr:glutamate-5-semialdehyde dehydrogenase [Thermoplasmata archaeon]
MPPATTSGLVDAVRAKAQAAREAALKLARAADATRAAAVVALANALERKRELLLAANAEDLDAAKSEGLAAPLLARLKLTPEKLALTLAGVRQVAALPDPLGRPLRATRLDRGLVLTQTTVPLGVVACVFESRPDAAIQIPALALRSGNAVLLKGGAEAERTNRAIVEAIRAAIDAAGIPRDAVQLLEGRAEANALLAHDDLVDLVIPRGSAAFVRHVKAHTRIPVLGHAEGVCHVYVDAAADPRKAIAIALDSKTDNPSACNAAECILVHEDAAPAILPALRQALHEAGVEVREDAEAFGREFGDMTVALALVKDLDAAIAFVNRHGSKHTDAIVTEDTDAARRFVAGVDSAGVFVNASTRFADGYRYGLGAEVGISTSKVHARGPVGLEGLTTTKWVLVGQGHTAAPYQGAQPRPFLHEPMEPRDPL